MINILVHYTTKISGDGGILMFPLKYFSILIHTYICIWNPDSQTDFSQNPIHKKLE